MVFWQSILIMCGLLRHMIFYSLLSTICMQQIEMGTVVPISICCMRKPGQA